MLHAKSGTLKKEISCFFTKTAKKSSKIRVQLSATKIIYKTMLQRATKCNYTLETLKRAIMI